MRYLLGLGNYAMGDDSVGLRLVEHIAEKGLEDGFEAIEVGNNGMLVLTYFREDTDLLLVVDAVCYGGAPGEFTVFTPDDVDTQKVTAGISTHEGDILKLIELAKQIDQHIPPIKILAIQPASMDVDQGLSPELEMRFEEYVQAALREIREHQ
ncbi:MAG: hydrogenase maturation protease [Verrucomicrobia bacterium]|jgi:hydrogenase maturation protease|nr:hydrogenase maturation protease [Verrucomicrobiota bacterium]MBT7068885.1 hydrogenase maturation protease [Verrucomicrobiota bacterium]MBT7701254.1 hydrogenase maturation protease [Verrucomicrobiota bacterium]